MNVDSRLILFLSLFCTVLILCYHKLTNSCYFPLFLLYPKLTPNKLLNKLSLTIFTWVSIAAPSMLHFLAKTPHPMCRAPYPGWPELLPDAPCHSRVTPMTWGLTQLIAPSLGNQCSSRPVHGSFHHYQKYYYRMRPIRSGFLWTTTKTLSVVVHIILAISIIGAEFSAVVQHEELLLIMLWIINNGWGHEPLPII
jgi:hypothetical protein